MALRRQKQRRRVLKQARKEALSRDDFFRDIDPSASEKAGDLTMSAVQVEAIRARWAEVAGDDWIGQI